MKKIKIGLIGVGHLGAIHLKDLCSLNEKAEVVSLNDVKKDRTLKLAEHYNVPFTDDFKTFIGKIDAVDICVPTESHYKIAKFFLENKVHTFIEKPITTTLKQADELISIAEKNKVKLQVGHIERFNSGFQSVLHFIKKPLFIECHRLNHFPNRSLDIGVVLDLMIHDIDIVLGLNQCPIVDIQATGINVLTPFDDIASVRLTFENGCVCNLTASRISDEIMRKIRVFSGSSYISLDYVKQEAFIYKKFENQILKHNLPIEKEQPLKRELEHFMDCVQSDKKPLVSGIEGRDALKVALNISKQIKTLKKTIKIKI